MTDTSGVGIGTLNPFRYRTYYYDIETGFYYLQSRCYDPETGRFINADAIVNCVSTVHLNQFVYCLNNHVNMADYDGLDAVFVVDYSSETGLPVFGHSLLYLQDADGNWYRTQFAKSDGELKVTCYEVSQNCVDEIIAANPKQVDQRIRVHKVLSPVYQEPTTEYAYFSGDYTECLKAAQGYADNQNYGKYLFFTHNCNHYVKDVLLQGDPDSIGYKFAKKDKSIVPAYSMAHAKTSVKKSVSLSRVTVCTVVIRTLGRLLGIAW